MTASDIKAWTEKDPLLSQVRMFVSTGWPSSCQHLGDEMKPYWSRKDELSIFDNCLLWGSRIIVPPPGRKLLLELLHESHAGVSRMKSLGRGYLWWPGLDKDIEQFVKQCSNCQLCLPCPPLAPVHAWENPQKPWYRIHLDFAGPFIGRMYLVLADAYSKWLDVCVMNTITSGSTIEKLQAIFAVHGLPKTIVTDNGPSFTSDEFKRFLHSNGIHHITSSPYHPSTNGLAVQSFKLGEDTRWFNSFAYLQVLV